MSAEKRVDQSSIELIIGLILMFLSWLTILFIVIDAFKIPDPNLTVAVSIACYISSIIGFGLSTHGLYTRLAKSRKEKRNLI